MLKLKRARRFRSSVKLIRSSGLFATAWYLERNPDVAAAAVDPIRHYLEFGSAEGRSPHPLFETQWYLENNPDVAGTGENALCHFLSWGWREGRDPNPYFDTSWYLAR
jgi:hypothetical protein